MRKRLLTLCLMAIMLVPAEVLAVPGFDRQDAISGMSTQLKNWELNATDPEGLGVEAFDVVRSQTVEPVPHPDNQGSPENWYILANFQHWLLSLLEALQSLFS